MKKQYFIRSRKKGTSNYYTAQYSRETTGVIVLGPYGSGATRYNLWFEVFNDPSNIWTTVTFRMTGQAPASASDMVLNFGSFTLANAASEGRTDLDYIAIINNTGTNRFSSWATRTIKRKGSQ